MNATEKRLKVVICAEYQGEGGLEGTTSGFLKSIDEWINQSGMDNNIDVVVYCMGIENKTYNIFPNVRFKQHKPNLSIRDAMPLIPTSIFPFLVDLLPFHPQMIKEIIQDQPDVIHTFQTFGVTDFSGFAAAKIMKMQNKPVRLVNTVMSEIDTYFADYIQRMVSYFYSITDEKNVLDIIKDSARNGTNSTGKKGQITLGKFLIFIPVGGITYTLWKTFELLGNIQDFIIKIAKFVLKIILKQKFNAFESKLKRQLNILRGVSGTSQNRQKFSYWLRYLVKPIQLIYDFVRRGDTQGSRIGLKGILSHSFRWLIEGEISAYLNNCDAVVISRIEDSQRYQINVPVWEVPLACDLEKFKVYEPSMIEFIDKLNYAVALNKVSSTGAEKLINFLLDEEQVSKRCMIYVGRLSDEKNISMLIDAYEQLLSKQGMKEKIHFIFVGVGYKAAEIETRFQENVTVTGLIPNEILPDIYNFVRQRNGFFVSASDTETYGITHEEATACGLPLLAMEKGTRGHFYCPGDTIGDILIDSDGDVKSLITELADPWIINEFIFGLNGLCIPDYSAGLGLSKIANNSSSQDLAANSFLSAMLIMNLLPNHIMIKMSQYASNFAANTKLGWQGTWQMLRAVYLNNLVIYDNISEPKKHRYFKTFAPSKLLDKSTK